MKKIGGIPFFLSLWWHMWQLIDYQLVINCLCGSYMVLYGSYLVIN